MNYESCSAAGKPLPHLTRNTPPRQQKQRPYNASLICDKNINRCAPSVTISTNNLQELTVVVTNTLDTAGYNLACRITESAPCDSV